ncbi:MAG: efflux RND transporter periplasmic adaptor subunit, partial [Planctomycetota bacterium]
VKVSREKAEESKIEIKTAGSGIIKTTIDVIGEITLDPEQVVHVVSRASGIVRNVHKKLGDTVEVNEKLAYLESAELAEEKMKYLRLQKELESSEVSLKRSQTIFNNTSKLLVLLKTTPNLQELHQKIEGLYLGKSGSELVSFYLEFLLAQERYQRESTLHKEKISKYEDLLKEERIYKKTQSNYWIQHDKVSFSIQRDVIQKEQKLALLKLDIQTSNNHLNILGVSSSRLLQLSEETESYEKLSKIELLAPMAGTIIEKHLTQGEILQEESVPFVIANLDQVWVKLNIYQKDLPKIALHQKVQIKSDLASLQAEGKIARLSALVKEETRTVTAYIPLDSLERQWKPGMFISAQIILQEDSCPIVVSTEALQTLENNTVIFVFSNDKFEMRSVEIGKSDGNWIEIKSGISVGEEYAAKNSFILKADIKKAEAEHQH